MGGNSSLKANHRDKGYNVTLEHVFETAKGNLAKSQTSTSRTRRREILPFFFQSKNSVSEETHSTVEDSKYAEHRNNYRVAYSTSNAEDSYYDNNSRVDNYHVAYSGRDNDSEAIFLMKDSGMGKTTNASTQGMLVKTLRRVAGPILKTSSKTTTFEC